MPYGALMFTSEYWPISILVYTADILSQTTQEYLVPLDKWEEDSKSLRDQLLLGIICYLRIEYGVRSSRSEGLMISWDLGATSGEIFPVEATRSSEVLILRPGPLLPAVHIPKACLCTVRIRSTSNVADRRYVTTLI